VRIGIDLDGVCYKWDATARYMLREVLPNSPYKAGPLKTTESQHWDWIKEQVAPEHWAWLWEEGPKLGLYRYGHLYPGTVQAIRRLAELGEVVFITHRPKDAVNDTLAWLGFLDLPVSGLHLLTNMEPKSTVLPHCDIYLDDKPENIYDLDTNTDGMAVLRRQPWNWAHHAKVDVYSWTEFILTTERLRKELHRG
jgi:uncharacterized HAD superfamily protein